MIFIIKMYYSTQKIVTKLIFINSKMQRMEQKRGKHLFLNYLFIKKIF